MADTLRSAETWTGTRVHLALPRAEKTLCGRTVVGWLGERGATCMHCLNAEYRLRQETSRA